MLTRFKESEQRLQTAKDELVSFNVLVSQREELAGLRGREVDNLLLRLEKVTQEGRAVLAKNEVLEAFTHQMQQSSTASDRSAREQEIRRLKTELTAAYTELNVLADYARQLERVDLVNFLPLFLGLFGGFVCRILGQVHEIPEDAHSGISPLTRSIHELSCFTRDFIFQSMYVANSFQEVSEAHYRHGPRMVEQYQTSLPHSPLSFSRSLPFFVHRNSSDSQLHSPYPAEVFTIRHKHDVPFFSSIPLASLEDMVEFCKVGDATLRNLRESLRVVHPDVSFTRSQEVQTEPPLFLESSGSPDPAPYNDEELYEDSRIELDEGDTEMGSEGDRLDSAQVERDGDEGSDDEEDVGESNEDHENHENGVYEDRDAVSEGDLTGDIVMDYGSPDAVRFLSFPFAPIELIPLVIPSSPKQISVSPPIILFWTEVTFRWTSWNGEPCLLLLDLLHG